MAGEKARAGLWLSDGSGKEADFSTALLTMKL
jgi:hypothetical protein